MINIRNTKQKNYILKCLKERLSEHLSPCDIARILKENQTPVSKATIYRYLSKMQKDGLVRKYEVGNKDSSCYQYIDENSSCNEHYHLICQNCSRTLHFQSNAMSKLLNDINLSDDFYVDAQKTIFYGLCKQCKKKESVV